jgi:hypothetical protein
MWDKQIDEVARDLTSRGAPAGFRTRVLARLEPTRRPRLKWVPIAVLSLMAVVVVAFLITTTSNRPDRIGAPTVANIDGPSSREPDSVIARGTPPSQITSQMTDGLQARRRVASARYTPVRLADRESSSAAPDPLAMEALSLPILEPEIPVTIEPLVTELIVLEALDIRPIDKPAFGTSIDEGDR